MALLVEKWAAPDQALHLIGMQNFPDVAEYITNHAGGNLQLMFTVIRDRSLGIDGEFREVFVQQTP